MQVVVFQIPTTVPKEMSRPQLMSSVRDGCQIKAHFMNLALSRVGSLVRAISSVFSATLYKIVGPPISYLLCLSIILSIINSSTCQEVSQKEWLQSYELKKFYRDSMFQAGASLADTLFGSPKYDERIGLLYGMKCYHQLGISEKIIDIFRTNSYEKLGEFCILEWDEAVSESESFRQVCDAWKEKPNLKDRNRLPKPELADQLVRLLIEDQGKERMDTRLRNELIQFGFGDLLDSRSKGVNPHKRQEDRQQRLENIIEDEGFPLREDVGPFAMQGVFVVILHGGLDFLSRHEVAFKEAFSKGQYAYLVDKKLVAERNPQLFGTQIQTDRDFKCFYPIDEVEKIDLRRYQHGLPPIEYYAEEHGIDLKCLNMN